MSKTSTTRFTVTLADGTDEIVQTTLEDRLAFQTAIRKNRSWGKLEDNTIGMVPFMAWNALRRTGRTALSWAEFTSGDTAALAVDPVEEDDADADLEVEGLGKDTQTAASPTSPSSSHENTAALPGPGVPATDPS